VRGNYEHLVVVVEQRAALLGIQHADRDQLAPLATDLRLARGVVSASVSHRSS
jgi:hypothetical protein